MATIANQLLDTALEYAGYGWRVIPNYGIRPDGSCECRQGAKCGNSAGKHPRIPDWQNAASTDEDVVAGWWGQWPNANVGVLLGQSSNLIDIEADSDEGRETLRALFDGELPLTLCFESGKGRHYLFQWRDDLPGGANVPLKGLDLKFGNDAKGSQSIFPPSKHASGIVRKWIIPPEKGDLEVLADTPLTRIHNGGVVTVVEKRPPSVRQRLYKESTINEGGRDAVIYREACALWGEQSKIYGDKCFNSPESQTTVFERLWAWNVAKCRPPLDDAVILQKCDGARAFIQRQGRQELRASEGPSLTALGLEFKDEEWHPGAWHVETINSDPRTFRLFAPFIPKGFVDLDSEQYNSPAKVHAAVLEETMAVCLDDGIRPWTAIWKGRKPKSGQPGSRGLYAKLLDDCKQTEAPQERKEETVCAAFLLGYLTNNVRVIDDDKSPPTNGLPFRRGDGSTWFSFEKLLQEASYERSEFLNRITLSRSARSFGAVDKTLVRGSSRRRFLVLDTDGFNRLNDYPGNPGVLG